MTQQSTLVNAGRVAISGASMNLAAMRPASFIHSMPTSHAEIDVAKPPKGSKRNIGPPAGLKNEKNANAVNPLYILRIHSQKGHP